METTHIDPLGMIGSRFSRLVVVCPEAVGLKQPMRSWLAVCDCGTHKIVPEVHLRAGSTQSCGCLRNERMKAVLGTHGHARRGRNRSREYGAWSKMTQRCTNPDDHRWGYYGGRGIKVCEAWLASFEQFLADVGPKPTSKHSLGRLDNDGDYEPGNVRWETPLQQARNRRDTVFVTVHGESKTLAEWAALFGVDYYVAYHRIKAGWTPEKALSTAVKKGRAQ